MLAAKAAGKPVVVSMGDYGASGGYWISSQANEIVAEPSTLTGSIGVFGGKLAIGPALAKFGIDIHGLSVGGDYAGAFGAEGPMTPTQRAAFSAWMDKIYQGFVTRVAQGRRLPVDRVMEIAKGHVWTGAQAKDLGLVDQIGGYQVALQRAEALAGLTGEVRVRTFPTTQSPFAALLRLFGGGDADSARLLLGVSDAPRDPITRDLIETLHQAHLRAEGATVLAPIMPFSGR